MRLTPFAPTAVAVAGGVLLIVADSSTLRGVRALQADVARVSTGHEDGHALLIVGVIAIVITVWGAIAKRRAAALAVLAAGVASAVVVLAVDLPSLGSISPSNQFYSSTTAWNGSAIYFATAGSALLLVSGALGLIASRPPTAR